MITDEPRKYPVLSSNYGVSDHVSLETYVV